MISLSLMSFLRCLTVQFLVRFGENARSQLVSATGQFGIGHLLINRTTIRS